MAKHRSRGTRKSNHRDAVPMKLMGLGAGFLLIPFFLDHSPIALAFVPLRPLGLLMFAAGGFFFWFNRRTKNTQLQDASIKSHGGHASDFDKVRPFPAKRKATELDGSADQPPAKPMDWSTDVFDVIEWRRFEALVEALFQKAGFLTKSQSHGADDGVDIWLYQHSQPDKPVSLIQCKHWQGKKVGVDKLREFLGVMTSMKVQRGQYATSSTFTPDAAAFAQANGIDLLDASRLLMMIDKRPAEQRQAILDVALEGEYWKPTCVNCGIKMASRTPRDGGRDFWGCTNYPKCKTTMPMRGE